MRYVVPVGLFVIALAVRLVAAVEVPFPTTEPSAFYLGVAQNLVAGHGLVSDSVWSYATEPLVVPKPAFTLWMPMSTFVSALAMGTLGDSFWAAQVGHSLLGALVAPLAWAVGREAANAQGLDSRRGGAVAVTAGLLAAVLSPLVLSAVVPDSYTPFTVFMLTAAVLVPRVVGARDGHDDVMPPSVLAGLALGLALGLAYLSRQEVIWMGLTVVLIQIRVLSWRPTGARMREALRRLWPVFVGGLIVVVPWLVRNTLELGTPMSGQALANMFLVDNDDIFAFRDQPGATSYLAQGAAEILRNPFEASYDGLVEVLLVPAFPVGLVGLLTLVAMWRAPFLRRPTSLMALLLSGLFISVSTAVLFPVATLAGTFMHASGALLVGLAVVAAMGGDTLLARISTVRDWQKPNVVIAPVALVSTALLMTAFQVMLFGSQSRDREQQMSAVVAGLETVAAGSGAGWPDALITDHPMWLANATDRLAIALPDEDIASVQELARRFGARWVVVIDGRGRYPEALLADEARPCLTTDPVVLGALERGAWLFQLAPDCGAA